MDINEAFPSKYLKAADLQGHEPRVIMDRVEMVDLGEDKRPVLYFQGKEKGVVLNRTNSNNIGEAYGYDTDDWFGKPVILFTAWVDFQGKSVEAIRIRPDNVPKKTAPKSAAKPNPRQKDSENENPGHGLSTAEEIDDAIPF